MNNIDNIVKICKVVSIISIVYEAVNKNKRRWWVREVNETRDEDGFFKKCYLQIKEKDEEHFFKLTRMNVSSFNLLYSLLKEKLEKFSHRKPINPECRLVITLIYLGHGCNPQILAWSFKIGISTVREIIYETCATIYGELHGIYLSTPNTCEWSRIASGFLRKCNLPNSIGAIDGKHIRIVCPRKSGSVYFNYKKYFSLILLGICDSNYTFTFYKIGAVGSRSDSGVFMQSDFGKKIISETINFPVSPPLPGTINRFPYYFVGDAAFPLKKNLMRPFPGRNLPRNESNFNKRISKARVYIENSFGILANRWRILHTAIYCKPDNIDKIVSALILLHNFLMIQKDQLYFDENLVDREVNGVLIPGSWREDENQLEDSISTSINRPSNSAFHVRNKLKEYLSNH